MNRLQLGTHAVADLAAHYRRYLFEEYWPFWDAHGIDHERGGLFCALDHDGSRQSDAKNMWYQGRGLWTHSYMARHFDHEPSLQAATRTKDFLLAHGRDADGWWVSGLDADGAVTAPATPRGYESLFVAEGLTAYAAATQDDEALDIAVQSLRKVVDLHADPQREVNEGYVPLCYPGMRVLGGHMVLILTLTQMLELRPDDAALATLADDIVEGITQRFYNERYDLMNEALANDLSRPDDDNEDFSYLGHAIETMWMTMVEALRRRDRALFDLCAARFQRHVEVAWDDVYGGLFRALKITPNEYTLDKVLWLQEEGLIGSLLLLEHGSDSQATWAARWFERIFDWVEERCSLKPHGHPLYQISGDRQMTFVPHVTRKENYHHPRCIMRCLQSLERLQSRDGAVSDAWA
jgi:N-acylglucosamine 2-epimerase